MGTRRRYAELDGYRGIAALGIVAYHAWCYGYVRNGRYPDIGPVGPLVVANLEAAVSWFFVLSGLVIFLPFARAALAGQPSPAPLAFLARRACRLLPAYYAALVIVALVNRPEGGDLLAHLTFLHIFDGRYAMSLATIPAAWSLACEAIYYLAVAAFAPPAVALCARLAPRQRAPALLGLCAAIAAASVAYKAVVAAVPASNIPVHFGPLAKADSFALGVGLAVVAATGARLALRAAWYLRAGSLLLMAATFLARPLLGRFDGYFFAANGAAFALLLASTVLARGESRWARALSHPALVWLGGVSYGLYLWHQPLMLRFGPLLPGPGIFWGALVVGVVAGLPLAWLGYRLIECPALHLRFPRPLRALRDLRAEPLPALIVGEGFRHRSPPSPPS